MSSTFTVSRDQIISLALRKLGVLELGSKQKTATFDGAILLRENNHLCPTN